MLNYPTYSKKQKSNHWISAVLVLVVIGLPLTKVTLSSFLGGMGNIFTIHKSLGVIIFFITAWRIYVVLKEGVPEVLPKNQRFQHILSKIVQGMIYLLLLILPLSGYMMSGRAINFFGLFAIPNLPLSETLQHFFHSVHIFGAYSLIALLVLHLIAAIYHHFIVKDNVLKAMLPKQWFN